MTDWYEKVCEVGIGWVYLTRVCTLLELTENTYSLIIDQLNEKPTVAILVQFYTDLYTEVRDRRNAGEIIKMFPITEFPQSNQNRWTTWAIPNLFRVLRDLIVWAICIEKEVKTGDDFQKYLKSIILANMSFNKQEMEDINSVFLHCFWKIAPDLFNMKKIEKKRGKPKKAKFASTLAMSQASTSWCNTETCEAPIHLDESRYYLDI